MADAVSALGLLGLFNVCLEGYKLCLTAKDAGSDFAILRARMFLERERFVNVCAAFGLAKPENSRNGRANALREYIERDAFRRRGIAETLEAVAVLLARAERVDKTYSDRNELPDVAKDKKNPVQDSLDIGLQVLRRSFNRVVKWSLRDKAAYEAALDHLKGFNDSLEQLHPATIQQFLNAVLPATICASTGEGEISIVEQAASASPSHAFLASQIQWKSSVCGMGGIEPATNRYLGSSTALPGQVLLIDWLPWMEPNSDVTDHVSRTAGLLRQSPSQRPELRLLPCAAYLEEADQKVFGGAAKVRYALAYRLPAQAIPQMPLNPTTYRTRSLRQLLLATEKKGLQLPLLETRLGLARSLCRAMLLYHSSGWVHHDFRSHNILFAHDTMDPRAGGVGGDAMDLDAAVFDGVPLHKPYIVGFGHARDEEDVSLTFADPKSASRTLKQQRLYWAPSYLASSATMRRAASFQRVHDIYSLGCVLLELGVWRPLEAYTWQARYDDDHALWHRRLLQELKLGAMCGSRYVEAVRACLLYGSASSHEDVRGDVQSLAFDILLALEEIVV